MISILVACGSGVATSTIAADEVKSVCEEYGISAFKITKCSMQELATEMSNADLVLTTARLKAEIEKPHLAISGFITGINEKALREKLGVMLTSLTK